VSLYQKTGQLQAALLLCEELIEYIESHQWDKIPSMGKVYLNYADLNADIGDFDLARTNMDKGWKIAEIVAGPDLSGLKKQILAKLENPQSNPQGLVDPLTDRELEVLELIAQGLSNNEICARLYLALNTIKGYNRTIFSKLGVKNRTEAANRARELGLV
jgi:DNA-binding CsgD family transcriptional regulator